MCHDIFPASYVVVPQDIPSNPLLLRTPPSNLEPVLAPRLQKVDQKKALSGTANWTEMLTGGKKKKKKTILTAAEWRRHVRPESSWIIQALFIQKKREKAKPKLPPPPPARPPAHRHTHHHNPTTIIDCDNVKDLKDVMLICWKQSALVCNKPRGVALQHRTVKATRPRRRVRDQLPDVHHLKITLMSTGQRAGLTHVLSKTDLLTDLISFFFRHIFIIF